MMNSGVSASNASGTCTSDCSATSSCHHTSRPRVHGTASSSLECVPRVPRGRSVRPGREVRRTTTTCSTALSPLQASSATAFTGTTAPRRCCPSVVTRTLAPVSSTRKRSASAENPPKTRECTAPMRAQASVMMTVSGMTGR